jgi:hypothetical protein
MTNVEMAPADMKTFVDNGPMDLSTVEQPAIRDQDVVAYCLVPDRPHAGPDSDRFAHYALLVIGAFPNKDEAFAHLRQIQTNGFIGFNPMLAKTGVFMPTHTILNPVAAQRIVADRRIADTLRGTCNTAESMAILDRLDNSGNSGNSNANGNSNSGNNSAFASAASAADSAIVSSVLSGRDNVTNNTMTIDTSIDPLKYVPSIPAPNFICHSR